MNFGTWKALTVIFLCTGCVGFLCTGCVGLMYWLVSNTKVNNTVNSRPAETYTSITQQELQAQAVQELQAQAVQQVEPQQRTEPTTQPEKDICESTRGKDQPNYFGKGISSGAYVAGVISCFEAALKSFNLSPVTNERNFWDRIDEQGRFGGLVFDPKSGRAIFNYCQCTIERAISVGGKIDIVKAEWCGRNANTSYVDYYSQVGLRKLKLNSICMTQNEKFEGGVVYCGCYIDGVLSKSKNENEVDLFCRKVTNFWNTNKCHMPAIIQAPKRQQAVPVQKNSYQTDRDFRAPNGWHVVDGRLVADENKL